VSTGGRVKWFVCKVNRNFGKFGGKIKREGEDHSGKKSQGKKTQPEKRGENESNRNY